MKFSKKILAGAVAASLAMSAFAPMANAEISASAGVASTYLWRGLDLGSGTPAVSGDLSYSAGGFYTTLWGSSGDTGAGTEWDLGAGYGGSAGMFSYDVSVWNYMYPNGGTMEDQYGDLTEVIVALGLGPVSFSWYENIATEGGDESYRYFTLGYATGPFSFMIGSHTGDDSTEFTHLDISYAYNDNLSFTFSQVVDQDEVLLADGDGVKGKSIDDDLKFVVSYSLPIE